MDQLINLNPISIIQFPVRSMTTSDTFENKIAALNDMVLAKTPSNTDNEWQWHNSLLFF